MYKRLCCIYSLYNLCTLQYIYICHTIILMYHLLHIETTPRTNSSTSCKIFYIQSTCNSYIYTHVQSHKTKCLSSYLLCMSDSNHCPDSCSKLLCQLLCQEPFPCVLHCLHHCVPSAWEVASPILLAKPLV